MMMMKTMQRGLRMRRMMMLRSMSDGVSDPVLNKIGAKHHELKQQYDEMETYFPENSFDPRTGRVDADMVRRKRIIYRSKQRGWLEVDLMLGRFIFQLQILFYLMMVLIL